MRGGNARLGGVGVRKGQARASCQPTIAPILLLMITRGVNPITSMRLKPRKGGHTRSVSPLPLSCITRACGALGKCSILCLPFRTISRNTIMAWAWTTAAILILPTRLVGARRFIPRRWVRGLSCQNVSIITCMPDVPESWLNHRDRRGREWRYREARVGA